MRKSVFATVALLGALLALAACARTEQTGGSPAPAATAPATPAASAQPATGPQWVRELPARPVAAKVGDTVWATVPKAEDDMAEWFGPCTVSAVAGDKATLKDDMGKEYPDVPGSLILPPQPPPAVKAGDVVTLGLYGSPKVGLVVSAEGGKARVKYAWAGQGKEDEFDKFQLPAAGVAPLSWVLYQGEGAVTSKYKGFVVAREGDKVWVLAGSGHVVVKAAAEVWPLAFNRTYAVGQKVFANYPCYSEAVVKKVLEPGLRYQVEFNPGKDNVELKPYFFDDLVVALP